MIEAALLTGFFAVACTVQDVVPLTGQPIGEPHALSMMSRDGKGSLIGWTYLSGQVAVRRVENGLIRLDGISFSNSDKPAWAELRQDKSTGTYKMEWLIYDHPSREGHPSVVVWAKGYCEQLGADKETAQ